MKTLRARNLATILTALLVFGGGGAFASSASASTPEVSLIPEDGKGSITVHKFDQPVNYGKDNLGMELPSEEIAGFTALPGATFQISQVSDVDLTRNPGWKDAQRAVDGFDPFAPSSSLKENGFGLKYPRSVTTDFMGTAKFSDLPVGLYLVEETMAPPVASNQAVTKSMPFLITVPLTDPAGLTKWVYDVHVYPKNVLSSVTKTVADANTIAAGQTLNYSIHCDIPGGAVTTKYMVSDQLDPRLAYQSSTVNIAGHPTSDFQVVHEGGLVTVTLGKNAREQAYSALLEDAAAKVTVIHTVTVLQAGEIDNDATLTFQREGEWETDVPSTIVETKFGGINLFKHDRGNKPLAGAVFEVRSAHADNFEKATTVSVNGTATWTTDAAGKLSISGLRYSGFADGAPVSKDSGKYNYYWLVEIKAPTGYELLANPIPFTVDSPVATSEVIDVLNTAHNAGGMLPKTGADGTGAFVLLGSLLVASGGATTLAVRRRRVNS